MSNEHWIEYDAALKRDAAAVEAAPAPAQAPPGGGEGDDPEWGELTELIAERPTLDPPPLDCLPEGLRRVEELVKERSTASDWACCAAILGALSIANMRRFKVRYSSNQEEGSGFLAPLVLYVGHESASGGSKSSIWGEVMTGLEDAEAVQNARYENALRAWGEAEKTAEIDEAGRLIGPDGGELRPPLNCRFMIRNATTAIIQGVMGTCHPIQAQVSEESAVILGNFSHTGKSETLMETIGTYTGFWSGRDERFERVTHQRDFYIKGGAMALLFLSQPGIISKWMMAGEYIGLAARFLFSYDKSELDEDVEPRGPMPPELAAFNRRNKDAALEADPFDPPPNFKGLPVIALEPDADAMLHAAFNDYRRLSLKRAEPDDGAGTFMRRIHEHAARIAALLWLFDHPSGDRPIPMQYAQWGLHWAEAYLRNIELYAETAALEQLTELAGRASAEAVKNARAGLKKNGDATITVRGFCPSRELRRNAVLQGQIGEILIRCNHIRPAPGRRMGRYEVHPDLLGP